MFYIKQLIEKHGRKSRLAILTLLKLTDYTAKARFILFVYRTDAQPLEFSVLFFFFVLNCAQMQQVRRSRKSTKNIPEDFRINFKCKAFFSRYI